jgi:hypothetical protein
MPSSDKYVEELFKTVEECLRTTNKIVALEKLHRVDRRTSLIVRFRN